MVNPLEVLPMIDNIARNITFGREQLFEDARHEMIAAILADDLDCPLALALHKAKCNALDALQSRRYNDSHDGRFLHVFVGDWRVLERRLEPRESFEDNAIAVVDAERFMSILSSEEQELVQLRFWGGLTQEQISDLYGVSRSAITRRCRRVLAKMRSVVEGERLV
jgi:RNA polymerase sigma factor (sigma-70 family)